MSAGPIVDDDELERSKRQVRANRRLALLLATIVLAIYVLMFVMGPYG